MVNVSHIFNRLLADPKRLGFPVYLMKQEPEVGWRLE